MSLRGNNCVDQDYYLSILQTDLPTKLLLALCTAVPGSDSYELMTTLYCLMALGAEFVLL
jgi:hypothetical protein